MNTDPLYTSSFFNNNDFSFETLWVYTTTGTLHTDTPKTPVRRIKQYQGTS